MTAFKSQHQDSARTPTFVESGPIGPPRPPYSELLARRLMTRLKFRDISLLISVHQLLSIRAAAAYLGWSQPAANKRLLEIEDALGFPLYIRAKTTLRPTNQADLVYRVCLEWRVAAQALAQDICKLHQGHGTNLVLGVGRSHFTIRLLHALERIAYYSPQLEIAVRLGGPAEITQGLLKNTLHMGIGVNVVAHDTWLTSYKIPSVQYQLVASASLAPPPVEVLTFGDARLAQYKWITLPPGEPCRTALNRILPHGADQGLIEVDSIQSVLAVMAVTPAIALLPSDMVAWATSVHGVVVLSTSIDLTFNDCFIAHRVETPVSLAGQMLIDLVTAPEP